MAMSPESFVAELDAQNQQALDRIATAASSGDPGEAVTVPRLLLLALKNELEATECAAAWISTTPEVDVKLAFARQAGDEATHPLGRRNPPDRGRPSFRPHPGRRRRPRCVDLLAQ